MVAASLVIRGVLVAALTSACAGRRLPAPGVAPPHDIHDMTLWRTAVAELRTGAYEPLLADQIAAGYSGMCALDRAGAVWCWGQYSRRNDPSPIPQQIALSGPARTIDGVHTGLCALLVDGRVECWGPEQDVEVIPAGGPATAIALGIGTLLIRGLDGSYTCTNMVGGHPGWCEPRNIRATHEFVDGMTVCLDSSHVGLASSRVFIGLQTGPSLKSDGKAICGHRSDAVILGPTPIRCAAGLVSEACRAHLMDDPERDTRCELRDSGEVRCAGDHARGLTTYLGVPAPPASDPFVIMPIGEPVAQLAGDSYASSVCARGRSGKIHCWGDNKYGEAGLAPTASTRQPARVAGLTEIVEIDGDDGTFCALDRSGRVWCWGAMGCNDRRPTIAKATLYGRFAGAHTLTVGAGSACVLTAGGGMGCFGISPDPSQVEPESRAARAVWRREPARDIALDWQLCSLHGDDVVCRAVDPAAPRCRLRETFLVQHVTGASDLHGGCILTRGGGVHCLTHRAPERTPAPVVQLRSRVDSWCGRLADGDVVCTTFMPGDLRRISGLDAVDLAYDGERVCAVNRDGGVGCWQNEGAPEVVPITDARRVALGPETACALLGDETVACWGDGDATLGRGYLAHAYEPLVVMKQR